VRELGPEAWVPPGVVRGGSAPAFWCNWVSVEVLFEIASTKGGATEEDHKRELREVLDAFACALLKHTSETAQPIRGGSMVGGFIDNADAPTESGARYLLTLAIGKSVTKPVATTVRGLTPEGTTKVNGETQCAPAEV
jgi:hypothetical protein